MKQHNPDLHQISQAGLHRETQAAMSLEQWHDAKGEKIDTMISPRHDLVLLEMLSTYQGQLIVPQGQQDISPQFKVVAVGPGRIRNEFNELATPDINVGDVVYAMIKDSAAFRFGERRLLLIQDSSIIAKFEQSQQDASVDSDPTYPS